MDEQTHSIRVFLSILFVDQIESVVILVVVVVALFYFVIEAKQLPMQT